MSCEKKLPGCFGCNKKGLILREFKNYTVFASSLRLTFLYFSDFDSLDVWKFLDNKNLHNSTMWILVHSPPKTRSVVSWTWSNAHFMPYNHQALGGVMLPS